MPIYLLGMTYTHTRGDSSQVETNDPVNLLKPNKTFDTLAAVSLFFVRDLRKAKC